MNRHWNCFNWNERLFFMSFSLKWIGTEMVLAEMNVTGWLSYRQQKIWRHRCWVQREIWKLNQHFFFFFYPSWENMKSGKFAPCSKKWEFRAKTHGQSHFLRGVRVLLVTTKDDKMIESGWKNFIIFRNYTSKDFKKWTCS